MTIMKCKVCNKLVGCYFDKKLHTCKKCDRQPNCQKESIYKTVNKEFLCAECSDKA